MADLDSLLATICSTSRNGEDTNFTKLLDVVDQLRQALLVDPATNEPAVDVPDVLKNAVVFKSVFCFLLDARRAVRYLEELGRAAVAGWSTLVEAQPLEFVKNISGQQTAAASEADKSAVIVLFLRSAVSLAVTVIETLHVAREARVQTSRKVWDGGGSEDRFSEVQEGLNNALVNSVHLGKLMRSRTCAEDAREMFAGFSVAAQLVYDHGDYTTLREMMSLSEAAFQLTHDVLETIVDLKVDVTPRFLPPTIKTLVTQDHELSYRIPFRMYWCYMYVQMERVISSDKEWKVDQHLSNANHYCADTGATQDDGSYAFICWLLYGLSLYDCGMYATAEAVLKLDHMRSTSETAQPSSKTAADCLRRCAAELGDAGSARKEHLLYFGNVSGSSAHSSSDREATVWHSIYDDPAVRKYSPRHVPDYVEICRRLTESDELSEDAVQSLILESVGPFIDLAYQSKKPTKVVRSDNSVNIYGGSVNENLDVQSHSAAAAAAGVEEVPDIDMMMAVTPSQIGLLDTGLEASDSSDRYAYLLNLSTGERLPSFELLVDSLPIALNKVAEFVTDIAFAEEYEIISVAIHGPAIATTMRRGGDTVLSYDHVPAFWIRTWPDVATEWITRRREYGWPSASVVEEIIQDGVLLVAACHSASTDPNHEWRISFTIAERILVDSLTSVQRLAFLYAKLVWMSALKSSSFLVSYHLKNALLWLCEERPSEFWAGHNLVVCVADIFRWLRREIGARKLRNYFIATDNMIPAWVKSTDDLIRSLDHVIDNVFEVRRYRPLLSSYGRKKVNGLSPILFGVRCLRSNHAIQIR